LKKVLTNSVAGVTILIMNNHFTAQGIKELREKLGMTQQELADKVGVDRVTVARWETEQKRPSQLARRQLARLVK